MNAATDQASKPLDIGMFADVLAVSPNGRYLYLSESDTLQVVDVATMRVIAAIPLGSRYLGSAYITVSPNGETVYVASNSGDIGPQPADSQLEVVSIAAKKVTKVIDQGDSAPCGLAANPNGKEVYESYCDLRNSPSISSDLRVLNTSSNTASRRIAIPNLSQGIAFSPNGKYAYVAEGGESGFSVINTSTNKAVKQVPIAASSSVSVLDRVSISSNGQDLYATSGPPPIFGPGAGSLDVIPLSSGVTR